MCDIVFEKAKGCGGTVNRASLYGEVAVGRVQMLWEISQNS